MPVRSQYARSQRFHAAMMPRSFYVDRLCGKGDSAVEWLASWTQEAQ